MITNTVTMEQGITITQLKGQAYQIAADGSQKLLAEGDVLPKGAVIMSPDGASFMGGGQSFNVQPASEQSEPAEEGDAPQLAQNGAAGTPDEINALQQAILGGADPTQAFEASAAGGAPAAGGGGIGGVAGASGNGGFVTIDRTGSATIAEATFDTTYNATGEPPLGAAGEDDPLFTSANLVLSADTQVSEGGLITFTATLDEPVFGSDLVISLSNGAVITIPVGQSSGSVTVAAPADSPYVDPSTITVSITGTLGGGFNQIITSPSTTTQINDTVDTTTVTLGAPAQVNEGGQITYSASVNNAPQSDLVLTLSNGSSITIKAGELSGSVTVDAPSDDVYKDGSSLTVSITGSSGGNYEQLDTSSKVTTEVGDSVDTTTVTLGAPAQVNEGGQLTYSASVNQAPQSDLVLTLSNGASITIKAGELNGSVTVDAPSDDVYKDGSSLTVSITGSSGGNYEQLDTSSKVTTEVTDTMDDTTVSLSATGSLTEAGGIITYTATLTNKAQGDVTVTLDNGKTITILDGATTGSVEVTVGADEDVYLDASSVSASITTATGGNFESLVVDKTAAVTQITDTVDVTTVSLSATGSLTEAGGIITYTATLTNKAQGDVTVTLDNGKTITILDGATTGSVEVTVGADEDVYLDASSVSASITTATGGNFESLVVDKTAAVTQITDTVDVTTVSLSATGSLTEAGGIITYTATLTNKAQGDVTVTLDNGKTITILDGATTGSVEVTVGADEDVYLDASSVSASITTATGGNFESLVVDKTAAVTQITDTVDVTTVSLSATGSLTEAGGIITYTATLTNKAQGDVTVTLDNGKTITILDGATTGSVEVTVGADEDVYLDASSVSASITTATGGNFESLVVDKTAAVTQITDTVDVTTVSLSATGSLTEAGGIITYTATLTNKAQGDVTVTLDNGKTITILDGATTGSVEVTVGADEDVYLDASSVSASITTATGGNFESLVVDKTAAVTQITDTVDVTTVSLSATGSLTEAGGIITYTATLTNKAQGDVTVTLDNGKTITILDGATTGSVEVTVGADEDVYLDASSVSASITTATGGNFESLVVDKTAAVTQITDTVDVTTVSLSATGSLTEAGGIITYTATLTNKAQGDVTVTLDNGKTITILDGATTGSVEVTVGADEDVYLDASSVSASITTATGGNFESLVVDKTAAVTQITDTVDVTTVSLSATGSLTEAGGIITYTATLTNKAQGDVTVTLDNGKTITILDGATTGSVEVTVGADEDVYLDASSVSASITTATGGNFESLVVDKTAAVTQITDTVDVTTVSLSATGSLTEAGGIITYTATLTNKAQGDVTVTLDNGKTITILDGATTGSVEVTVGADEDVYLDASSVSASITTATGGNFESLVVDKTAAVTQITDTVDVATVSLSATGSLTEAGGIITYTATLTNKAQGDVTVTLDNGKTITILDGATTGSVEVTVGADEDVYLDASSVSASITTATGGNFESLVVDKTAAVTQITDTISEVIATLTADKTTVSEGGEVTYTVTLTSKDGLSLSGHNGLIFTLSNGQTITIGAGQTSGSVTVTAGDDVYSGGQNDLSATLTNVSGGDNFEKLTLTGIATTTVTDEPQGEGDRVSVSLSGPASVTEGQLTGEYTVTLSHEVKPGDKVLLTYTYGTAGEGDFTKTVEAVIDGSGKIAKFTIATINDVLIEGNETFSVRVDKVISATTGQNVFELLDTTGATVTTSIIDNDSVVALQDVIEGTAGNVLNVADGVAFTGTTALGGAVSLVNGKYVYQAPVRNHADSVADTDSFTYTKADGSTVTYTINILDTNPIAANDSGSVAVGLNAQTIGSTSLLANDTVVDSSSANPAKVYSVTGLNGQVMVLGASGSVTVAGKYGDLTVNADGNYTYTSKLDTDVQAVEGGAAVKSAFAVYGFQNNSLPLNGTSLNLTGLTDSATALVDVRTSGNNAKPGIGVSQSGSGTNDIGSGEALVIGLKALSNFAQIGINELNSGQGSASWKAYDANGVLVGSGTLLSSSNNGSLQSFNISTNTPFQYLVLGYSGNQNGYVIDSIKYTPAVGAVTEEFAYTVKDNDGDVSNSAVLTLNGNVPTTVAPTMLMGIEDTDVALTWASFGISDNASTVRISGNQDGTGIIKYLDSTGQYKVLGQNETKIFSKVDIDSGKVKFDPADNMSGADIYGPGQGLGNKGNDLTTIRFDVLQGADAIATGKSVVVDLTPVADKPLLSLSGFQSLAAINFEDVKLGSATWSDNIDLNTVQGAGTIGIWKTADGGNRIEVGKESVYVGGGSSNNQVMEIEGKSGVKTLYADFNCEGGRFYQLGFDIAARTSSISSSALTVKFVQLDVNGVPVGGTERVLYNFNPTDDSWKLNQLVGLPVDTTAKYRLIFESNDSDSYGAILDNIKFQAVDNKGYEDSFIKLSAINSALVDIDGSETLTVEISGLPKDAVLKDAANHSITVDATGKALVSGWSLSTLQLKVNDPGNYNLVVKATATEVTSTGKVLDTVYSEVFLPVQVLAANVAPVITAASVAVSEEGLASGLVDTTDFRGQSTNLDSTNDISVSGKLAISDANGDTIQSVKLVAPTESFTSGGSPIKWSVSTDGLMLTGKVGDNGPTAVTVTIDKQGNYNVNLFKPLDHVNADNVEGRLAINVGVEVSDGKLTGTGTLTIQVEDDRPVVVTPQTAHIEGAGIQTNLMLIVDVSGSMTWGSGVPGKSRLDIAKESLLTLLSQYDSLGTTMVRIVLFNDSAKTLGDGWLSVSDAKKQIWDLQIKDNQGTEYDDGINKAMDAFLTQGKLTGSGVQNVSYFISDGDPASGHGVPEQSWVAFTKQHDIKAYALGMGSDIKDPNSLHLAAYDGVSEKNTDAIVVTDMSKLEQVISGTAQRSVSGDLFGQVGTGTGADGGAIRTVRIDGHIYAIENGRLVSGADQGGSYDARSQQLVITLGNGDKLTIGLVTGEYLYQTSQHGAQSKSIGFELVDADGDRATGSLNLTIEPSDNGRTFVGNDGDDHLTVLNASQVHIALGGVHGGGPQVTLEQNIDTRSGVTLYGGKGYDHLTGGLGDDILSGGTNGHGSSGPINVDGKLYYGDVLTGGDGADTFQWQQGDALEQGSNNATMTPDHAIDYITDFKVEHTSGWQQSSNSWNDFKNVDIAHSDKLDLSDMLDHSGSNLEGDLSKLLSAFEAHDGVHLQVKSAGNNQVSQEIVLLGSTFESITGDISNHVSGSPESASQQVINYMLQNHLLDIDK